MVLFNYSTKEITAKIVYYGPGLCGKTTNLQFIYDNLPRTINKGKMLSLATKTDRTLFFDFLPIDLGTIRGMRTRLQLYTVPGQVFYNTTRKLVLKGADGIVFVADSQKRMIEANIESFKNLEENLAEHDMNFTQMPHIIQFNKRDLPDVASIDELNAALNKHNAPIYEAVATTGIGVHETLKAITRLVLNSLKEKYADKREQRPEAVSNVLTSVMSAGRTAPAETRASARASSASSPNPGAGARDQTPPLGIDLAGIPRVEEPDDAARLGTLDLGMGPIEVDARAPESTLETLSEAEPILDPLFETPGRTARGPAAGGSDEPLLELVEDDVVVLDADSSEPLPFAQTGPTPPRAIPDLEKFEEPFLDAPAPLDVTAEVFRAGMPPFPEEPSPNETFPPIPIVSAPAAPQPSDSADPAPIVLADDTALIEEDRHDDPLDFASLLPEVGGAAEPPASTEPFAPDHSSAPFAPEVSTPVGVTLPALSAEAGVADVAARALGAHEIQLPISLEIGGRSIRFQLKITLDLTGSPAPGVAASGQDQGVRS